MKHILIALAMLAMLRLAVPGQTVAFSSCKGEVPQRVGRFFVLAAQVVSVPAAF